MSKQLSTSGGFSSEILVGYNGDSHIVRDIRDWRVITTCYINSAQHATRIYTHFRTGGIHVLLRQVKAIINSPLVFCYNRSRAMTHFYFGVLVVPSWSKAFGIGRHSNHVLKGSTRKVYFHYSLT